MVKGLYERKFTFNQSDSLTSRGRYDKNKPNMNFDLGKKRH